MVQLVEQTTIARSPGDVWNVLGNFAGISKWAPNVDHSCLMSDQSQGAGAVRRIQTGNLVTGQNQNAAPMVAREMLRLAAERSAAAV